MNRTLFITIFILIGITLITILVLWPLKRGQYIKPSPPLPPPPKNTPPIYSVVGQVKGKEDSFLLINVSEGYLIKLTFTSNIKFMRAIYRKTKEGDWVIYKTEPITVKDIKINDMVIAYTTEKPNQDQNTISVFEVRVILREDIGSIENIKEFSQ